MYRGVMDPALVSLQGPVLRTLLLISPQISLKDGPQTSLKDGSQTSLKAGPSLSIRLIRPFGHSQLPNGCLFVKIG